MNLETADWHTLGRNRRLAELAYDCLFINADEKEETLKYIMEGGVDDSTPLDTTEIFRREKLVSDENIEFLTRFDTHLETHHQDIKFGQIASANGFADSDEIEKALEYQKEYFTQTGINVTIGDLLVHEKVIRPSDRVAILLTQNRIKEEALLGAIEQLGHNQRQRDAINKRFGVIAIKKELVTRDQVNNALEIQQKEAGGTEKYRFLGRILQETAGLSDKQIQQILGHQTQFEKRRLDLEKALYTIQSETKVAKQMNRLFIYTISKDGIEASVKKKQGTINEQVSAYGMLIWLRRVGICYGIVADAVLEGFINGDQSPSEIIVARGYPAEPSVGETVEFCFETTQDSEKNIISEKMADETGNDSEEAPLEEVDPENDSGGPCYKAPAQLTAQVKKRDILARIIPGHVGKTGKDVMGHSLHPAKPSVCYLTAGAGVYRKDNLFFARTDGQAILKNKATLLVAPEEKPSLLQTVNANLSKDTGDQYQDCQVTVKGDITFDAKIQCRSLLVMGDMAGQAICTETAKVKGSIGTIRSASKDGEIQGADILCLGRIQASKTIANSTIQTHGKLLAFNSTLINCNILACKGMTVKNVIKGDEAPTILQFGLKPGATILGTSNAIEDKQRQLSDLKQESKVADLALTYEKQLQAAHEHQERQAILKNLVEILQAPELDQVEGLGDKIEHLKRLPKFSSIRSYYLTLPETDSGIKMLCKILSGVIKKEFDDTLAFMQEQIEPEPEPESNPVSADYRLQMEYQERLNNLEKEIAAQSEPIKVLEAEIWKLGILKKNMEALHVRSIPKSDIDIQVRNMCEKGTVIKGRIAHLILEKTIYNVRFKEILDPKTHQACIVIENC